MYNTHILASAYLQTLYGCFFSFIQGFRTLNFSFSTKN